MIHAKYFCICSTGSSVDFLKKNPFSGGGAIRDPRDFIWTNLNLLVPRMLHANLKSIMASGSWEEDFLSYKPMFPWGGAIYDPRNFICAKFNFLVPRLLHNKYQYIWAIGL